MRKSEFQAERERHLREFQGLTTDTVIHLRLVQAVEDAEAAGVKWDPEEPEMPELPRRVRVSPGLGYENIDTGDVIPVGHPVYHRISEEALAAYNREREQSASDGVTKESLAAHLLECTDALQRLASEAGVPNDGPNEIVNNVLKELREVRSVRDGQRVQAERARCVAIIGALLSKLEVAAPVSASARAIAREVAYARRKVESGEAVPIAGAYDFLPEQGPTVSEAFASSDRDARARQRELLLERDDLRSRITGAVERLADAEQLPAVTDAIEMLRDSDKVRGVTAPEPSREWPERLISELGCFFVALPGGGRRVLTDAERDEAVRRWEAVDRAVEVIRKAWPSTAETYDRGGSSGSREIRALYSILTGKEAQRLADVAEEERLTRPWRLRKPLDIGDCDCAGEVEGPEGAYFDFSDSERWSNAEAVSLDRLLAQANAAEIYRKALEPFAARFSDWLEDARLNGTTHPWFEGTLGPEEVAALREACHLMGIEPG